MYTTYYCQENRCYRRKGVVIVPTPERGNDIWKVQIQIKGASFDLGDKHRIYTAELNQRYTINRNNAVRLNFKRERFSGFYSSDVSLSWNRYF